MMVVAMATRVEMHVVDLETRMTTNRNAEYRDVMTILVRVFTIVMAAVDTVVVRKKKRDLIVG